MKQDQSFGKKLIIEILKSISTFFMLVIPLSFLYIGNVSYDFGVEKYNTELFGSVDNPNSILGIYLNESAFKNLKTKKHSVTSKEYVSFVTTKLNDSVDEDRIRDYLLKESNEENKIYYFIDKNSHRTIAYSTDRYGKIGHLVLRSKTRKYENMILNELEIYKKSFHFNQNSRKTIIDKRNDKITYYQSSTLEIASGTKFYDFTSNKSMITTFDAYNDKYKKLFITTFSKILFLYKNVMIIKCHFEIDSMYIPNNTVSC